MKFWILGARRLGRVGALLGGATVAALLAPTQRKSRARARCGWCGRLVGTKRGHDTGRLQLPHTFAVLLLLAAPCLVRAVEQRPIRVVMDDNYPPFVFRDDDGKLQGILVDQWRLWENKTGRKIELCGMDWGDALRRMQAGEFDVIDTVFRTKERTAIWEFSKPYATISVPIFFRKNISAITDLKSLQGFAVAVKEGDSAEKLLRDKGVTLLTVFKSYEAIVQAARDGEVNVFVVDEPPAHYFLNKMGIQDQFRESAPVNIGQFRRAVRKGDVALLATVEAGFASLNPAELKQIEEKWYGQTVAFPTLFRYMGYFAGFGLLLILGLVVWNLALERVVKARTGALERAQEIGKMGNWELDVKAQTGSWSKEMFRLFGRDPGLGPPSQSEFLKMLHPHDLEPLKEAHRRVLQTRQPQKVVYRTDPALGPVRYFESIVSTHPDARRKPFHLTGTVLDITERKQVELELQRLSAHLIQVQDVERRNLARELHDTTAQHVAALTLHLENLQRHIPKSSQPALALCADCIDLAKQAGQQIRTQSYLLHPPLLDVLGLTGAVEEYARGFSSRSGIAVEFSVPKEFGRLPEDTELALFRVVQESLANVWRHSGSRRAQINFTRQDSSVTLEVRDMGKGIPSELLARFKSTRAGSGVGLGGMQERLRLLGGRLDLESCSSGTTIRATVPIVSGDGDLGPGVII